MAFSLEEKNSTPWNISSQKYPWWSLMSWCMAGWLVPQGSLTCRNGVWVAATEPSTSYLLWIHKCFYKGVQFQCDHLAVLQGGWRNLKAAEQASPDGQKGSWVPKLIKAMPGWLHGWKHMWIFEQVLLFKQHSCGLCEGIWVEKRMLKRQLLARWSLNLVSCDHAKGPHPKFSFPIILAFKKCDLKPFKFTKVSCWKQVLRFSI